MSSLSILVIEPHPLMRTALVAAIAAEPDMDVAEPFNAVQPDIVLFAVGNPGDDDLRALSDLHLSLPETPILALTSHEVRGQEQAALDCGARAVVTKSAPRSELILALRTMIAKSEPPPHLPSPELPKEAKIEPSQSQPVSQGTPLDFTKHIERKTQ